MKMEMRMKSKTSDTRTEVEQKMTRMKDAGLPIQIKRSEEELNKRPGTTEQSPGREICANP
jgi:flagellar basal body-associated protein FliL